MTPPNPPADGLKAVPLDRMIELLRKAGSELASREVLERHREEGAPITADGSVNLVGYAAWLVKRYHGR